MKACELQDRQEFKVDAVFFKNYAESELQLAGFIFPEQWKQGDFWLGIFLSLFVLIRGFWH